MLFRFSYGDSKLLNSIYACTPPFQFDHFSISSITRLSFIQAALEVTVLIDVFLPVGLPSA